MKDFTSDNARTKDEFNANYKDHSVNVEMLTRQLEESDSKILDLNEEVTNLKALVERLNTENFQLKNRLSQAEGISVKSSINGDNGSVLDEILVSVEND